MQEAAFCEQALEHGEVGLSRLPLQRCCPDDIDRLPTFGLVVTRAPAAPR